MLARVPHHKAAKKPGLMTMLRRLPKNERDARETADPIYERIFLFVRRKLSKQRARVFTDAILVAGKRYDRYQAAKGEWKSYSARRARLDKIGSSSAQLANSLLELDMLTRDDLAGRLDEGMTQSLVNSLLLLRKEAAELIKGIQQNGRWRDLAEERWIFELANIYENIFFRPAKISGSGDGEIDRRGDFYRLLTVSLPASFPRHGKLSVKQVDRVLKRRSKRT